MAENSAIEWTDSTFNPWIGCTRVSPACDDCYAARSTPARTIGVAWGHGQARHRTADATWRQPLRWNDRHAEFFAQHGRRRRVFCASLADVFDNEAPEAWRDELMGLIASTPQLDWLLLTKRIGNVARMLKAEAWQHLPHVWLGATVVNQAEADRDIPKLLAVPARVRFLSIEPMLGPIDLRREWLDGMYRGAAFTDSIGTPRHHIDYGPRLHWVIAGGESGPKARPAHPDWFRSLRDQCAAAGAPFLFKQWGEWLPWAQFNAAQVDDPIEQTRFETREFADGQWIDVGRPDYWDTMDGAIEDGQCVGCVGKKAAGRLLDGLEHNGFPGADCA